MEKLITVSAARGKKVKGFLRGPLTRPLVIMVHGLTGDPNEHQFYNGARFLEKKGFSSFRYYLYDSKPLRDATLASHAADFDKVVAYFRKRSKSKIFAVGHSYGGATILVSSQKDLDGAVLWDPTYFSGTMRLARLSKYDKRLNAYVLRWYVDYLLGKKMVEEEASIAWKDLGKDVTFPLKVVIAGNGRLHRSRQYADNAKNKSGVAVVKGASHNFEQDGAAEQLFTETTDWLRRCK